MKLNWPLVFVLAPVAMGVFGQIHPVHRHPVEHLPDTNPPFVTNLTLWLWAKSMEGVIADGSTDIVYWPDIATHPGRPANDFVPMSGYQKAIFVSNYVNGMPAMNFWTNGTDGSKGTPFQITNTVAGTNLFTYGASGFTIFFLIKANTNGLAAGETSGLYHFSYDNNTTIAYYNAYPQGPFGHIQSDFMNGDATHQGRYDCGLPVVDITQWRRVCIQSATNNWSMWIDGQLQFSTNVSYFFMPPNYTYCVIGRTHRVETGGAYNHMHHFKGYIAEVLGYNFMLSGSERTNVDSWFTNKYALSP